MRTSSEPSGEVEQEPDGAGEQERPPVAGEEHQRLMQYHISSAQFTDYYQILDAAGVAELPGVEGAVAQQGDQCGHQDPGARVVPAHRHVTHQGLVPQQVRQLKRVKCLDERHAGREGADELLGPAQTALSHPLPASTRVYLQIYKPDIFYIYCVLHWPCSPRQCRA